MVSAAQALTFPQQHPLPLADQALVPQPLHLGDEDLKVWDKG